MVTEPGFESLDVHVRRTRILAADEARALRRLMDEAFEGDFDDTDWEHACGGTHYIARTRGRIVAHASIVPRTIWIEDACYHAGYVEAVAVAPELQRRGLGTMVMRVLERDLDAFDLGALSTGTHRFYERLGWERWRGPSWVRDTRGDIRSIDDDGGIMIKRTPRSGPVSVFAKITCEARPGDDW